MFAPDSMPGTVLNFDGIPFPGVVCNCAPPDTWRGGTDAVRPDRQRRLPGVQQDHGRLGARTRGHLLDLGRFWRRLPEQRRRRPDRALRPDRQPLAFEPVRRPGNPDRRVHRRLHDFRPHRFLQPLRFSPRHELLRLSPHRRLARWLLHERQRVQLVRHGLPRPAAVRLRPGEEARRSPGHLRQHRGHRRTHRGFLSPRRPRRFGLPAAGAPATFVEFPGSGAYKVFHFHADFAFPANSTSTLFASPAVAAFTELCPATRSCVPQAGTTTRLDGIGDRLMHPVHDAGGRVGVRLRPLGFVQPGGFGQQPVRGVCRSTQLFAKSSTKVQESPAVLGFSCPEIP